MSNINPNDWEKYDEKDKRKKLIKKRVTLDQKNNQIIEDNQKRGKL